MILNIQHEMNHILIRIIDEEKNSNFFLKSYNSKAKSDFLEFKDKFIYDRFHSLPSHESGNCFDFAFYNGYYFDNIFKNEANFFLDIKNISDINEYNKQFNIMMMSGKGNKKNMEIQLINLGIWMVKTLDVGGLILFKLI